MSVSGQNLSFLDYNEPLAAGAFYQSPIIDIALYQSLTFHAKTDQATSIQGFWKNDPSDSDLILAFDLTYDPATSPNGFSTTIEVKGVYFYYLIGNTSVTDQTTMNISCYASYSPPATEPSPVKCSNDSLTICDATAGTEAIAIGDNADAANNGVAIGYNAVTDQPTSVAIGRNSITNDSSSAAVGHAAETGYHSVAVGSGSYANFSAVAVGKSANASVLNQQYGCAIGNSAQTRGYGVSVGHDSETTDQYGVAIGDTAKSGYRGVSIGRSAGSFGTVKIETVCIGASCSQPGAAGRLAFGNAMEAVQTTATAGAQTLPANPAGFLRLEWNGTLYKIPVYND